MVNDWTAVVWVAALLVPLLLLKRWLNRHMQGLGLLLAKDPQKAVLLQYLVLLPGIVLHEVSHFVAAEVVGVQTRGFSLRPKATRGGNVRLGAVMVRQSDPIRESWIGLAPLLSGTAAILLLARWRLGIGPLPSLRPEVLVQNLFSYVRAPDAWLWLYLIFAVSNAMLPSESDRQQWGPVLLFLALAVGLVYVLGLVRQIPVGLKGYALTGVGYLTYAFGLTIVVDVVFAGFIWLLEKLGERLLQRRVEY
jgi:hypothetical protein